VSATVADCARSIVIVTYGFMLTVCQVVVAFLPSIFDEQSWTYYIRQADVMFLPREASDIAKTEDKLSVCPSVCLSLTLRYRDRIRCNSAITRFWLVPKSMTLNDLWARFKVIDTLNTAKVAKYSLVMTPTPRRVAGCIIYVRRTYSCTRAFTYLHSWLWSIKPAISPKPLKIERKLLLTAYIKSYTGFRLSPKCDQNVSLIP